MPVPLLLFLLLLPLLVAVVELLFKLFGERHRLNRTSSTPIVLNARVLGNLVKEDSRRRVRRPPSHPLELAQSQEEVGARLPLLLPGKVLRQLLQLLRQLFLLSLQLLQVHLLQNVGAIG